jgi:hypothetical protein
MWDIGAKFSGPIKKIKKMIFVHIDNIISLFMSCGCNSRLYYYVEEGNEYKFYTEDLKTILKTIRSSQNTLALKKCIF